MDTCCQWPIVSASSTSLRLCVKQENTHKIMTDPILSIVIANYNYGRFLEAAIKSVVEQDGFGKCELIVVDGGSTDNSVEVIKKYANGLPPNTRYEEFKVQSLEFRVQGEGGEVQSSSFKVQSGSDANSKLQTSNFKLQTPNSKLISWWCSEKDKGQSDAFNKGFAHARGKYLTWVNADDIMPAGCLKKIVREFERHPDCEWFTGNFYRFTEDGEVIEVAWGPHSLPKWLQTNGQPLAIYGPATFFTKELFDRVGGMKLYQNFMMDTDLWMRFIANGTKQRRINCFCWAFRMHEASKTAEFGEHKLPPEQRAKFEAERKRAYEETGYRENGFNRRLIQFWRLLDGSFVRMLWLKKCFRSVDS